MNNKLSNEHLCFAVEDNCVEVEGTMRDLDSWVSGLKAEESIALRKHLKVLAAQLYYA